MRKAHPLCGTLPQIANLSLIMQKHQVYTHQGTVYQITEWCSQNCQGCERYKKMEYLSTVSEPSISAALSSCVHMRMISSHLQHALPMAPGAWSQEISFISSTHPHDQRGQKHVSTHASI